MSLIFIELITSKVMNFSVEKVFFKNAVYKTNSIAYNFQRPFKGEKFFN